MNNQEILNEVRSELIKQKIISQELSEKIEDDAIIKMCLKEKLTRLKA